jgi:outer membrane immunogenic protein
VGGGISRSLSGLATREPFDGTGFRASPYVGLNWQFAPRWVAGVEGDFGFAGQTTTLAGFFSAPPVTISSAADSLAVKTMWDASLCGRFGFLLTPTTLVYATGGVACSTMT